MARIDLVADGFVYSTDFSNGIDHAWIISPNGMEYADVLQDGGLILTPSGDFKSVLALYSDLRLGSFYTVEAELSYNPSSAVDNAGIVLWSSDEDAVYLSVVAGGKQYQKLRLKVAGERCEAYAQPQGESAWEIVGTAFVSQDPLPGLYVEGGAPLVVSKVTITRDIKVTLGGVPAGYKAAVYDEMDNVKSVVPSQNGACIIPLPEGLITRGRIVLLDNVGSAVVSTELMDIYGGSIFWYNTSNLVVHIDGMPVNIGEPLELGGLTNGLLVKRIDIYNPTDKDIAGVTVKADCFNVTVAQDWIRFAPDANGVPGYYDEQVYIPSVPAGGSTTCWMKIERPKDSLYFPFTEHSFGLVITTES